MTRLITDGFETGDMAGWVLTGGSPAVITATKRSGTYSLECASAENVAGNITGVSELYIRMGLYVGSGTVNRSFLRLQEGGQIHVQFARNPTSGYVEAQFGSGTLMGTTNVILPLTTWQLIEIHVKIDNSAGFFQIKQDGILSLDTATNLDTRNAGTLGVCDLISLGSTGTLSAFTYDDIAVNDTSNADGKGDNSWCGDGQVIYLPVSADVGSVQWSGSAGGAHEALLDEQPPNTTDYIYSATVGNVDEFEVTASGLSGIHIDRVWPEARALKEQATADPTLQLGVYSGSVEDYCADRYLTTTYTRILGDEYKLNPADDAAWDVADVDALHLRAKVT